MSRSRLIWIPVLLAAAGLAAFALLRSPVTPPPARPNVLIVLWDTVRADRMSLYGHTAPTTPRLEALAADALVFDRATAPGMWTLPTHASMFTGQYATTHGARAGYRWLDHHHDTLAEHLDADGYDTVALSANLVASPMTNLTQGFRTVHTTFPRRGAQRGRYVQAAKRATRAKLIAGDASTEISPAFAGNAADKWAKSVHKDAAPVLHGALMDWLDERDDPDKPWFAYVNFMEAHTPRLPSQDARDQVMDAQTQAMALSTELSLFAENEAMIGARTYSDAELAAIRGVYDATLVDLDTATGALLDDLSARGVLDNTVVILVADHGEHLGEHDRFEHRWSVHEELLHVPLVVRYPAAVPPGRVATRVSTTDVFATVLQLTGVTPRVPHHSRSLLDAPRSPHVFAQLLDPYASQLANVQEVYPDVDYTPLLRTMCAAYEGDDKLIYASDGQHRLYDLGADPTEASDRFAAHPDRAAALTSALGTWEVGLPVYDRSRRTAADGGGGQTHAEKQMLQMLGYTDEDEDEAVSRCGPSPEAR